MAYFIGLLGLIILVVGAYILIRPSFGFRFFGDWDTPKLDGARITVTAFVLFASSFYAWPNLIFYAGCLFAIATIFFGIAARWQKGRKFVRSQLFGTKQGILAYVACVIIPMGVLLVIGATMHQQL